MGWGELRRLVARTHSAALCWRLLFMRGTAPADYQSVLPNRCASHGWLFASWSLHSLISCLVRRQSILRPLLRRGHSIVSHDTVSRLAQIASSTLVREAGRVAPPPHFQITQPDHFKGSELRPNDGSPLSIRSLGCCRRRLARADRLQAKQERKDREWVPEDVASVNPRLLFGYSYPERTYARCKSMRASTCAAKGG